MKKLETRKNSTMRPLWERAERVEQSGGRDGNLEATEEKEDENLDSLSVKSHPSQ